MNFHEVATEETGEYACVVELDETGCPHITELAKSVHGHFNQDELMASYLEEALYESCEVEDGDRETFSKYWEQLEHPNEKGRTVLAQAVRSAEQMKGVSKGTKYKPVDKKVKPVLGTPGEEFRIKREIKGDPLAELPELPTNPPEWTPCGRYTVERKEAMEKAHGKDWLWPQEMALLHDFVNKHEKAFAWDDTEKGKFREDFFPPVDIPVVPHTPWVQKNIPIPTAIFDEVCRIIGEKVKSGVYEPSNSSYRSRWFCVIKKDGKSLRIVHSLEPLNAVTIAHSGVPPATEEVAAKFAGRACGGIMDLYVGYDERMLAEKSRDYTTFQTPYGAMRLVTLPMGWTNSVPIFHEDVTFILKDEMPEYTIPYVDDVPIGGPRSRYEDGKGGYETIPENPGIRRFVWEHFQIANRITQRVKYCGGTFSGVKSLICVPEFTVVGHLCTYEGRKPLPDRVGVIQRWGPLKDIGDVRAFLGTVGTFRTFIPDYARRSRPIQKLTKAGEPFVWGPEQEEAMEDIKEAVANAPILRSLDYNIDTEIKLVVDSSWMGMGAAIAQQDEKDPKKWHWARFSGTCFNAREARYSQPKRELYGLTMALLENKYWLYGVRRLVVETDAKFLKGMLAHPDLLPNATINRWVETCKSFHFELRHVPGKTIVADGLSRRGPQPGDPPRKEFEELEPLEEKPFVFSKLDEDDPDPLDIEDFKHEIDTRGGYLQQVDSDAINGFNADLDEVYKEVNREELKYAEEWPEESGFRAVLMNMLLVPRDEERQELELDYPDKVRSEEAKVMDQKLPTLKKYLVNGDVATKGLSDRQKGKLVKLKNKFFVHNDKLYRRHPLGHHMLVAEPGKRMYLMQASHDALGHRGVYATRQLITKRFWWPDMDKDIVWYVKTCHQCQVRQKTLVEIPPSVTDTPSLFQQMHIDVIHMSPKSNGCGFIVHGRDGLSGWMEGRPLKEQTAAAVGRWLFEDVITRWGSLRNIISDNGKPLVAAVNWLEEKYGIKGITISGYNSQANGRIERPHWDVTQSLTKATGGDVSKWFWFFHHVMWADRVTVRKGTGCSPYFMVTGAEPCLPLDVVEATWLVDPPSGPLSREDLIGMRAQALAKHSALVERMMVRMDREKVERMRKMEKDHASTIRDYDFKTGDLVLVRNTSVESSLDRKMRPRYLGPMIVVSRNKGGAYIVAEMDGSVWQAKVGAFRVMPYLARKSIKVPKKLTDLFDAAPEELEALKKSTDDGSILGVDYNFHKMPKLQDS